MKKDEIPHLLCGDAARNQTMLEKVQAARRARLAALNDNDTVAKLESALTNSNTILRENISFHDTDDNTIVDCENKNDDTDKILQYQDK